MKKKLLYIGYDIKKTKTGGQTCCINMQKVLKSVFGSSFYKYSLSEETALRFFFNKCLLFYPGLQLGDFWKIKKYININKPDFVFIETAQYGALVKYLKRQFPTLKVITFFHNIEIEYAKSYFSLKNPKSWYFYILTKRNESCSIKHSDYCMTINENDARIMKKVYGRNSDFIFPFSIENTLSKSELDELEQKKKKIHKHKCLFVGSNFFGNTDGLNWFIQNVLPKTDIQLTIVGNGMSKAFTNTERITVYDFVEDLSVFYKETDFVLLPIISGGGMKTKTAEALMYGKAILGTPDVFFGYEVENLSGIYKCKTAEEFSISIEKIYKDEIFDFNLQIHRRFAEKHSLESTCNKMKDFFSLSGEYNVSISNNSSI